MQLLERQTAVERECINSAELVKKYTEITEELKTLFDRDYKEFVRDRRRWKSDFDAANVRAANNLT